MRIKDFLEMERKREEEGSDSINFTVRIFRFFTSIFYVIVLGVSLLFQHNKSTEVDEVDYEDEIEDRKWLQLKRQRSQYGKRFVIGVITFLMASVAFMGVEFAVAIGIALIVLALCVNVLIRGQEA